MILDNPEDDAKMREAFLTLGSLTQNDDEAYLLIAVLRMFHQVKSEYKATLAERDRQPQLHIVKH